MGSVLVFGAFGGAAARWAWLVLAEELVGAAVEAVDEVDVVGDDHGRAWASGALRWPLGWVAGRRRTRTLRPIQALGTLTRAPLPWATAVPVVRSSTVSVQVPATVGVELVLVCYLFGWGWEWPYHGGSEFHGRPASRTSYIVALERPADPEPLLACGVGVCPSCLDSTRSSGLCRWPPAARPTSARCRGRCNRPLGT